MGGFRPLLVLSLLLFSQNILSYGQEDPDKQVILDICKHTDYPDTCFKILSPDPRSKGRNFHELAELSIIINKEKGVQFLADISELQLTTTEVYAKRHLDSCYEYYDSGVVGRSSDSLDEFHAMNYHDASFLLNDCITSVNECDNVYLHPPSRPNVLRQRNAEMIQHSEIAQSLVDYISSW
ncbi:uncharacterized protein [Aristolochia californica]|uniref:uncharacterized protein n=1 Tax=Aristolochia californica TaxID=171875 RepID=UPI0035D6171D